MEKEPKNNKDEQEKQEFKGRNLEDAISLAEHTLKLPRTKLNYEIVAEKTKLFGIKSKEIVIATWPKETKSNSPISQFLDQLLELFPLDLRYHTRPKGDLLYIIFDGPDKQLLLRKDGALLLAIQHLLNKLSPKKVQVDCDFFRKRKEHELKEHVQKVARHVNETGRKEILDFMNPYERRIVHIAVNQIPGIATESIDDGFLKRIKIYPLRKD